MAARILIAALFAGAVLAAQTPRPLPDYNAFVAETRDNLARSRREQSRFAYKERRSQIHTNPFGKIGTGLMQGFEVTPVDGGAVVLRRLIERDGKPVVNGDVERVERRRAARAERASTLDDVAAALVFVLDHRETMQGRDVVVAHFTPREGARPETSEGRIAKLFTGTVWVDEEAREVIRVEATANDNISFGLGIVARLNKGTTVALTREAIDGKVFLPTSLRIIGQGRAMLFRKLVVDQRIEWFDYRRVE